MARIMISVTGNKNGFKEWQYASAVNLMPVKCLVKP